MILNNIERSIVTVTLDYLDCYVLGEALGNMGGVLSGPHEDRCQLYAAMSAAFLAAGMAGEMQQEMVDDEPYSLERMRAKHMPAID